MKLSNTFKTFDEILTKEQIEFLDKVCRGRKYWKLNSNGEVDVDGSVNMIEMQLTEIPVKFGRVGNTFDCSHNNLTTLKNYPTEIGWIFSVHGNNLKDYFKSIKEEDFPHWYELNWFMCLSEYPFLINTLKNFFGGGDVLENFLNRVPQTKLYYKD